MFLIRLIFKLFLRIFSWFFPKKYTPVSLPAIDEGAAIASVRGYLSRLGYLATGYHAQLRVLEVTRNLSDDANLEGRETFKRYDKLRCDMLMEFAHWDNQLLDRGPTSSHWNVLRDDVIASPIDISIHAMMC